MLESAVKKHLNMTTMYWLKAIILSLNITVTILKWRRRCHHSHGTITPSFDYNPNTRKTRVSIAPVGLDEANREELLVSFAA